MTDSGIKLPEMIYHEGGEFQMGISEETAEGIIAEFEHLLRMFNKPDILTWLSKSVPQFKVQVPPFLLSKFQVTNSEYAFFISDTTNQVHFFHEGWDEHPVTGISYEEADRYCRWLEKKTNRRFVLPTEAQWEWAASNGGKTRFPWGNEISYERANTLESGFKSTSPVGYFLNGASSVGVMDLAGNVEEWVSSNYEPYPNGKLIEDRIYKFNKGQYKVLRGGCYSLHLDLALAYRRHGFFPDYSITGFRLAETINDKVLWN